MSNLVVENINGEPIDYTLNDVNLLLNSDFAFNQRGGATYENSGYTLDRWYMSKTGDVGGNVIRQTTATSDFKSGFTPHRHCEINMGVGTTGELSLWQNIEDVRKLSGRTCTVSFWAKADANLKLCSWIDQVFGSGGSTSVGLIGLTTLTLSTEWQEYSFTVDVPDIIGKTIGSADFVRLAFSGHNGILPCGFQSGQIKLANVQLHEGTAARNFRTQGGSRGAELSLCKRYYQTASSLYLYPISGGDSVQRRMYIPRPVQMRVSPSEVGSFSNGVGSFISDNTSIKIQATANDPALGVVVSSYKADAEIS